MKGNEEMVVRMNNNGSGWYYFVRTRVSPDPDAGIIGGTNPTMYTVAATLGTALQAELPTLVTSGPVAN